MKSIFLALAATVLLTACGAPAGNNATVNTANSNKPANVANSAAPAAGDTAAAEAAVKQIMDTTQTALSKNDADAMDKIYADNYMTVNPDGSVQNRTERLNSIRSGDLKYESFVISDPTFRVKPDGTGVIAISKATIKAMSKGKPIDGEFRITGIYAKMADGWKLVGSQSTKIEGGSAPAKTEDKPGANANAPAANK